MKISKIICNLLNLIKWKNSLAEEIKPKGNECSEIQEMPTEAESYSSKPLD